MDIEIVSQKNKLEKEFIEAIAEVKKAVKLNNIKEQHQILNKVHKQKQEIKIKKYQDAIDLKIGDSVKYNSIKGSLISIKGKKATVETDDGMKLQLVLSSLQRTQNIPKLKPKSIKINIQKPESGYIKLDLHGQRADEAIENLDQFLSDSLIAGFDEVLVYHGIGTGKLARAISEFLDTYPSIVSYSDATPKNGGFGAKIIKL